MSRTWNERSWAALKKHGPTLLVLGVATVALTLPLATVQWLPFVDYPQHLGTIGAIHGQGDPSFDRYFVVEYARSQYLMLYVLGDWLASLFGVEGAGRATAILSVATLPLAVGTFLRAHGRPAILGALAAPVALHAYVFWGFLNFAAGMVVALLAAAAHAQLVRRPDARRAAWLALAALATFYTHAQLYAWMGLACAVQLGAMAPGVGWRRALRSLGLSAVAAIPSLAAMAWWLHRSGVIERGEAGARSGHAAEVAAQNAAPTFTPVADTLRQSLAHSFDVYRDGSGVALAAAFLVGVGWIVALRGSRESAPTPRGEATVPEGETSGPLWRRWLRASPDLPIPRSFAPELVLLLTFALYLFAPYSYRLIEPINHRFLPLALALLPVLGPRVALGKRAYATLMPGLIALAILTGQQHAARFGETDREMGELSAALDATAPGARLMGLVFDPRSEVVTLPVYLHAHQYYQARRGGLACFSFVEFPKSPVQYAGGAAPPPFPPRFEWTPQRYDHGVWGESFDFWLVRHEPGRGAPDRIFRGASPAPRQVFESERWTVFARE